MTPSPSPSPAPSPSPSHVISRDAVPAQQPLFVARLTGTQVEMGAQHGQLVADDAIRVLEFYRTMPERLLAGDLPRPGRLAVRVLADAWQSRLARDRPAELRARTEAFFDAVARARPGFAPRHAARTLATMDAMQNCVSLAARARLGPFANPFAARAAAAAVPACSTLIAWGDATHDGELMFARNFDFPGVGVWDRAPAFVTCVPDRGQPYGFFTTRGADTAVVTVVNEAGLVFAPHTRWHRGVTWGGAMIVDLVHDLARRAETIADVVAIARERAASSSWGIAVGSARERTGVVLELAGPQLEVVTPTHASHLICNNHYKTPSIIAGEVSASAAWAMHTEGRERRLRTLVEGRAAPLRAHDLVRFLGDRQDAGAPGPARQFGAIVAQALNVHAVVVTPAHREALVGVDRAPTCEGTWAELAWSWHGPAGGWELRDGGFTAVDHLPPGAPTRAAPGFTATLRDDLATAHTAVTHHVHTATRAYEQHHDVAGASAAIERAVAAGPDDPSLRLIACWLAIEAGQAPRAVAHARAGLAHETSGYRRGQLLRWGSRAATSCDPALAATWSAQLALLDGEGLDELRARSRPRGRPLVNLSVVDAY